MTLDDAIAEIKSFTVTRESLMSVTTLTKDFALLKERILALLVEFERDHNMEVGTIWTSHIISNGTPTIKLDITIRPGRALTCEIEDRQK